MAYRLQTKKLFGTCQVPNKLERKLFGACQVPNKLEKKGCPKRENPNTDETD